MSAVEVKPVRTRQEQELFLTFPWRIYQHDPLWVPPLLPDLRERLDPAKGVFFKRGGVAECFIAWRGGAPVGTLCAAEDCEMNQSRAVKECVFGFFDFIEDYDVFEALLAAAASWAAGRGLNALTGPFNLDYEDGYGVLVEGRDRPPVLLCGHSPAYYLPFYERYGFEAARGDNIAFALDLHHLSLETLALGRMAERVRARSEFRVRPGDMAHWEDEVERIYVLLKRCMQHLAD